MIAGVSKHENESLMPLIEIRDATVFRGSARVFHHFRLNLEQGCNTAILGPNGAGKTTTIKVMAGLMKPTSGSVRICGFDIGANPIEARRRMA